MTGTSIDRITFRGWSGCYRIARGTLELIASTDFGPRILSFRYTGCANLFKEDETLQEQQADTWLPRGGHRLWAAPENRHISYAPDNGDVAVEIDGESLMLRQPIDAAGIEKTMRITLEETTLARIVHSLTNHTKEPLTIAPLALTMMRPGGAAIAPLPFRGEFPRHLLPAGTLVLWPYTDFADTRWEFRKDLILLHQSTQRASPQKIGLCVRPARCAYVIDGMAFVKWAANVEGEYPDFGSTIELFTDSSMLELETLGPLRTLSPSGTAYHEEVWRLVPVDDRAVQDDAILSELLAP